MIKYIFNHVIMIPKKWYGDKIIISCLLTCIHQTHYKITTLSYWLVKNNYFFIDHNLLIIRWLLKCFILENVYIYYNKKCVKLHLNVWVWPLDYLTKQMCKILKFEIKGPFENFDHPFLYIFLGLNKFLFLANILYFCVRHCIFLSLCKYIIFCFLFRYFVLVLEKYVHIKISLCNLYFKRLKSNIFHITRTNFNENYICKN
jgi:hypothetical protein